MFGAQIFTECTLSELYEYGTHHSLHIFCRHFELATMLNFSNKLYNYNISQRVTVTESSNSIKNAAYMEDFEFFYWSPLWNVCHIRYFDKWLKNVIKKWEILTESTLLKTLQDLADILDCPPYWIFVF